MIRVARLAVAGFSLAASVAATSDVLASAATDQSSSNTLVTSAAAPIAASQAAGIIAGAVGGSVGGAPVVTGLASDRFAAGTPYFNLRDALRQTGESAGAQDYKLNVWGNGGYTSLERTDTGGELDGRVINGVVGIDYMVKKNAVVGLAFAYEDTDIDTTFNAGTFKGSGYTVAPYVGFAVSEKLTLDASFGYSFLEYDTTTGAQFGGATSSFDATRYFIAANATGRFMFKGDKVRLSPKLGVLYLEEEQDAFTNSAGTAVAENTISLGRVSLGAELGYRVQKVEPYLKAAVEYDWEHENAVDLGNGNFSADDEVGVVAGGGINLFLSDRLSGRIEGTMNSLGRENLDVWSVTGKLNYRF